MSRPTDTSMPASGLPDPLAMPVDGLNGLVDSPSSRLSLSSVSGEDDRHHIPSSNRIRTEQSPYGASPLTHPAPPGVPRIPSSASHLRLRRSGSGNQTASPSVAPPSPNARVERTPSVQSLCSHLSTTAPRVWLAPIHLMTCPCFLRHEGPLWSERELRPPCLRGCLLRNGDACALPVCCTSLPS